MQPHRTDAKLAPNKLVNIDAFDDDVASGLARLEGQETTFYQFGVRGSNRLARDDRDVPRDDGLSM